MSNSSRSSARRLMPAESGTDQPSVVAVTAVAVERSLDHGVAMRLAQLRRTLNAMLRRPGLDATPAKYARELLATPIFAGGFPRELAGDRPTDVPGRHCRTDPGNAGYAHGSCVVQAYHASGGVATSREIVELLGAAEPQPASVLARWIVGRRTVAFQCGSQLMMPRFQFDFADCRVRPDVGAAIATLARHRTDIEIARWFVQPNPRLEGLLPADVMSLDPSAVQNAAGLPL
jgi:hypothetical protein